MTAYTTLTSIIDNENIINPEEFLRACLSRDTLPTTTIHSIQAYAIERAGNVLHIYEGYLGANHFVRKSLYLAKDYLINPPNEELFTKTINKTYLELRDIARDLLQTRIAFSPREEVADAVSAVACAVYGIIDHTASIEAVAYTHSAILKQQQRILIQYFG